MQICRSQPMKKPYRAKVPFYEKDIVEYQIVQKVKKTGEGEQDFIVYNDYVETSRVNRKEFLNTQGKDHNIYGIIDKVVATGDVSLLHKTNEGVYGDFTTVLDDRGNAIEKLNSAKEEALKNIPSDLIGDQTLEQFVKNVTEEAVKSYYANKQKTENKEVNQ